MNQDTPALITTTPFNFALDHGALRQRHTTPTRNMTPFAILYTTEGEDQGVIVNFNDVQPELIAGLLHHLVIDHDAKWADFYIEGLSNRGADEKHVRFALEAGLIKSRSEIPATQKTLMLTQFTPDHTVIILYPINDSGIADLNAPMRQTALDDPTTHPMGMMPYNLI